MSVELYINHEHREAERGSSLFECAEAMGVKVPTSCRKQGKCKECLVEVVEGMECLSPPVAAERHLQGNFRLSCCSRIASESGVVRCHTLRRGAMRIEGRGVKLAPRGPGSSLDPAVRREGDRVFLDGNEIDCACGPVHGLAMDLGTTTVVLRLYNLESGELMAETSFENPQRFGGSDVMARIRYDSEAGQGLLRKTLAGYLTHAVAEFPVMRESIYEWVVAGNSTMRDLFFGLDVACIGQSPYQSVTEHDLAEGRRTSTSLAESPAKLRLPMNAKGRVYGLPIISGHVGADTAACLLAIDLAHEDRIVGLMDIGTNTEVILGNRHRVLAASCPAGPAFEGGRIACGMPGLPGAIERAVLQPDGSFKVQVIGDTAPEGICGSGLVDVLGELLRAEQMNSLGRFENGHDRVVLHQDGVQTVYLSEADINELAQAKGAHAAGLQIIFDTYGIGFGEVEVFYLAGGFGRYLDLPASRRIGLIPNLPDDKILQIGNASIEGASIALFSVRKRQELERLVRNVVHCRLETHPAFFDFFVDGCQFQPVAEPSRALSPKAPAPVAPSASDPKPRS